jgi:flagellar biosynthesis GTPase FlhF
MAEEGDHNVAFSVFPLRSFFYHSRSVDPKKMLDQLPSDNFSLIHDFVGVRVDHGTRVASKRCHVLWLEHAEKVVEHDFHNGDDFKDPFDFDEEDSITYRYLTIANACQEFQRACRELDDLMKSYSNHEEESDNHEEETDKHEKENDDHEEETDNQEEETENHEEETGHQKEETGNREEETEDREEETQNNEEETDHHDEETDMELREERGHLIVDKVDAILFLNCTRSDLVPALRKGCRALTLALSTRRSLIMYVSFERDNDSFPGTDVLEEIVTCCQHMAGIWDILLSDIDWTSADQSVMRQLGEPMMECWVLHYLSAKASGSEVLAEDTMTFLGSKVDEIPNVPALVQVALKHRESGSIDQSLENFARALHLAVYDAEYVFAIPMICLLMGMLTVSEVGMERVKALLDETINAVNEWLRVDVDETNLDESAESDLNIIILSCIREAVVERVKMVEDQTREAMAEMTRQALIEMNAAEEA